MLAACDEFVVFESTVWPVVVVVLMPNRCCGALYIIDGCNRILLAVVGVSDIADRNPYTLLLYSLDISDSDGTGAEQISSAFFSFEFST